MTTLTRAQAQDALRTAGWPEYLINIMVAVGMAESSLRVEVVGPTNADGTHDLGWLQISDRYVTGAPKWDRERLLSDPVYNARCAYLLAFSSSLGAQGLTAWYGYKAPDGTYPHAKFLPPHNGGPVLKQGSTGYLVKDMQERLNRAGASPALTVDGDFGPLTAAALKKWEEANPVVNDGALSPAHSMRLLG